MKPGIYEGIPEDEYRAIDAFNQSGAKELLYCPARYHYEQTEGRKETDAMALGRLVHSRFLEPDEFRMKYAVMPDLTAGILTKDGKPSKNPRGTSEYKERLAKWESENPDVVCIEPDTLQKVDHMLLNIERSEQISDLFQAPGRNELTLVWVDEFTGVKCKARLDRYVEPEKGAGYYVPGQIVDLKTTDKVHDKALKTKCDAFGYHIQAAHYLRGAKACGLADPRFFINVFVETTPPYLCRAPKLSASFVAQGEELLTQALRLYKLCTENDYWPGYPDEIFDLEPPGYSDRTTMEILAQSSHYTQVIGG